MTKIKFFLLLTAVFLACALTLIVQLTSYGNAIDSARETALVNWASGNTEREAVLTNFKQHCDGSDIKEYASIYACAHVNGSSEMVPVLQKAADDTLPPALLQWVFGK